MAHDGYVPARGDFVRVVLDPRAGREQSGERPTLVPSDRPFNDFTARFVCFLAPSPQGLVEAVLARVATILNL